jgi:tripartite-type tricarboxylate transporter receptor subunit TctC
MKKIYFILISVISCVVNATQPLEIVVPYSPGGATDTFARNLQRYLKDSENVSSFVTNKPGADGKIGSSYVMQKPVDSNTVLVAATGPMLFNKVLHADNTHDYTQFNLLVPMARTPIVIAVSNQSGITSLKEFVERAKHKPLNCGISNSASGFAGRYIIKNLSLTNVELITFKGAGDVLTNLLSGNIDCAFDPWSVFSSNFRNNKLNIIATGGKDSIREHTTIPLLSQSIQDFEFYFWFGLATVKTNKNTIFELAKNAYKDPAMISSLKTLDYEIVAPVQDSQQFLEKEYIKFKNIKQQLDRSKLTQQ